MTMSGKPTYEALERRVRKLEQADRDHKQVERALRESERRYTSLVNSLNLGVYRKIEGSEARFIEVNPAIVAMFGFDDKAEFLKLKTSDCYHNPRELEAFAAKLTSQGIVKKEELTLLKKDGSRFIGSVSAVAVKDDKGRIRYIDGIIEDITKPKQLQAQLTQGQKMEALGRLAGGVAHDINNILGVILGRIETAMSYLDRSQQDMSHPIYNSMEEIRKAVYHSAKLIEQLLGFARKQTIAPVVLDLNRTVADMLTILGRLIGENIDLAWVPGDSLWHVKLDSSQIGQLLANLCINARDAITGVGKVTIETSNTVLDDAYCREHMGSVPGEYVLLAVSDDGCGMDKEILTNLFEPFFTTKETGKSIGLGLSTVYGIVKQNNGYIDAHSEPDRGSSFKIYIPRHKGKAEQYRKKSSAESYIRGNETVLLVEDEAAILETTTIILKRLGYNVLAASSPGESLRMAKTHTGRIDLLVTDVVMPEMNGQDLSKRILRLYPNLKCLFMSGYTANVIANHGVLDPGVHFIKKPFSLKDLSAKVREVLDEAG